MAQRRLQATHPWPGAAAGLLCLSMTACNTAPPVEVGSMKFVDAPTGAAPPATATVETGSTRDIELEVTNPGNAVLTFGWKAESGSFEAASTSTPTNSYTAQQQPGDDRISVTVTGGREPRESTLQVAVMAPAPPPPGVCDFRRDTCGWKRSETAQTEGLVAIEHDPKVGLAPAGGSLRLELSLDPADPQMQTAEFEQNLTDVGQIVGPPLDLSNETIVYHVMFPANFPLLKSAPHGIQPFARDSDDRNYYGCYQDVTVSGRWIRVEFQPGLSAPPSCEGEKTAWRRDGKFNAASVTFIGFKIGANKQNKPYKGPVWLDDVSHLPR